LDEALCAIDAQDEGIPLSAFLLSCLPDRLETDRLIGIYLDEFEKMEYPMPQAPLLGCLQRTKQIQSGETLLAEDIESLAVTFSMISIALLYKDLSATKEAYSQSIRKARRCHHATMRCLQAGEMISSKFTAHLPLAWHLASRFLFLSRKVGMAWHAATSGVRAAQMLGMHRWQPLQQGKEEDAASSEQHRLLWAILFYDERTMSAMLDLPSSIDDDMCSQILPPPSASLTAERSNFVRWRHELAILVGKVLQLLQRNGSNSPGEVLNLDKEIVYYREHILPTDDLRQHFSFVHRFMIHSHSLQVRITLLRPFFLRTSASHTSERRKRQEMICWLSCAEAACQDLTLRESMVNEVGIVFSSSQISPHFQHHIRTPRWFASLIVCGIFLLTFDKKIQDIQDHKGIRQANNIFKECKEHLKTFLRIVKEQQVAQGRDAILEGEANVIGMFLKAADNKDIHSGGRECAGEKDKGKDNISPLLVSTNQTGTANAPYYYSQSQAHQDLSSSSTGLTGVPLSQDIPAFDQSTLHEDSIQAVFDSWLRSEPLLEYPLDLPSDSGTISDKITNFGSTFDVNMLTSTDQSTFWQR
jgi:hypothetical protein